MQNVSNHEPKNMKLLFECAFVGISRVVFQPVVFIEVL